MDPGTLGLIGTGLQIFGALSEGDAKADQARAQGEASRAASIHNAGIARENSVRALESAAIAADQGVAAEQMAKRHFALVQSKLIASYGSSGVVSSEGSPLDILAQSAAQGELASQNIKYKTALQVRGYTQRAADLERDAQFMIQSGQNAVQRYDDIADDATTAGWLRAGSTLLGASAKNGWFDSSPTASTNDYMGFGGQW